MRTVFLILSTALMLQATVVGGIAAIVKEEPITLYDVAQTMHQERLSAEAALDLLIREKLEAQAVKAKKLEVGADELQAHIARMADQNRMSISQLYDTVLATEHMTRDAFRDKVKKGMLAQKLYSELTYTRLQEPSDEEIAEYYRLHAEKFAYSETFEVTAYASQSRQALEVKMANPMRYLPEVRMQPMTMRYAQINPRLAQLLQQSETGSFLPIVPDASQGYVALYLHSKSMPRMRPFDPIKGQIKEMMMAEEREKMLKDYFERARMDADIRILRLP